MTDLYLIAHKVRGEPAFDVAEQAQCPECLPPRGDGQGCPECDGLGYWWIIPTSGHRAYPYWSEPLDPDHIPWGIIPEMPPSLPDHYPSRSAPTLSLAEALGLNKPKPQAKIVRRI